MTDFCVLIDAEGRDEMETTTGENRANKRRMGRPRKDGEELIAKGSPNIVRLPPTIQAEVKAAAHADGLSIGQWLRRLACVEIRKMRRGKVGV